MARDKRKKAQEFCSAGTHPHCWATGGIKGLEKLTAHTPSNAAVPKTATLTQPVGPPANQALETSQREAKTRKAAHHLAQGAARDRLLTLLDGLGSSLPTSSEVNRLLLAAQAAFDPQTAAGRLVAVLGHLLNRNGMLNG